MLCNETQFAILKVFIFLSHHKECSSVKPEHVWLFLCYEQEARQAAEKAYDVAKVDERVNKAVAAANRAANAARVIAVKAVQKQMHHNNSSDNIPIPIVWEFWERFIYLWKYIRLQQEEDGLCDFFFFSNSFSFYTIIFLQSSFFHQEAVI